MSKVRCYNLGMKTSKPLTEEQSAKLAKELRIKPKTKQFADLLLQDPTISHTQAYLATHKTQNARAASVEASKNLAKPSVQIYMNSHVNKAKKKIIELIDNDKPDIALKASQDVLDRIHGKATVKQENTSFTEINISLGRPDVVSEQ